MQQEDDLRGLEKVMQLMRGISVLFLLLHFYWFCYGWFDMHGCTLGVLDRLLRNVQRTTGLFTYSYLTKLFAAGFLALSCWGTRSVRSERITHRQIPVFSQLRRACCFSSSGIRCGTCRRSGRHRSMSQLQA